MSPYEILYSMAVLRWLYAGRRIPIQIQQSSDWDRSASLHSIHAQILSHHTPVKVPKSKYLDLKLIVEGILRYSQTKALSMTS